MASFVDWTILREYFMHLFLFRSLNC